MEHRHVERHTRTHAQFRSWRIKRTTKKKYPFWYCNKVSSSSISCEGEMTCHFDCMYVCKLSQWNSALLDHSSHPLFQTKTSIDSPIYERVCFFVGDSQFIFCFQRMVLLLLLLFLLGYLWLRRNECNKRSVYGYVVFIHAAILL